MDSSQCLGDRFRGFPSYILLASCVTLLAFYASQPGSLDDTFILLVYVRHFVESSQLYYNVSDGAVDGFTSVLDLILKSSVFSLFGGDLLLLNWIVTVSCMLGASAVGASLLLILRSSFSCYVSLPFMIVAISTLSLNPGLAEGATFLLEVPLFLVLFLTLLLLCITQKELPVVFGSLLFLLFLARPEGLVYGGVLLLYCRLLSFSRKFFITSSSIFIALSVGYLFWHFSYFGHVAPNTYYAKTSSCFSCELNDGFVNASRFVFLLGGGGIGGAVLALPLFSYFILQSHRRAYWGLWLLLVASFGIVIVEGGDSYQLTRFFAPAYAVGVIAVCFGYFASISSRGKRCFLFLLVLICLFAFFPASVGGYKRLSYGETRERRWPLSEDDFECEREYAMKLKQKHPASVVAQSDFQKLKYFVDDLFILDLSGLNSKVIAHLDSIPSGRYGKYSVHLVELYAPAVWVHGLLRLSHQDYSQMGMPELLKDANLQRKLFGYGISMTEKQKSYLSLNYELSSINVCEGFIHYFIRNPVPS